MAEIYTVAVETRSQKTLQREGTGASSKGRRGSGAIARAVPEKIMDDWREASTTPSFSESSSTDSFGGSQQPSAQSVSSTLIQRGGAGGGATNNYALASTHDDAQVADYYDLLQLMEEMLAGRNEHRTSTVVTAIVQFIIRSWTDHFARTVAMKLNCFFLMPFLDEFPNYLVCFRSIVSSIHLLVFLLN